MMLARLWKNKKYILPFKTKRTSCSILFNSYIIENQMGLTEKFNNYFKNST